jgi:hypothetical protein
LRRECHQTNDYREIVEFPGIDARRLKIVCQAMNALLDGDIKFSPVMKDGGKTLALAGKTKAGAL